MKAFPLTLTLSRWVSSRVFKQTTHKRYEIQIKQIYNKHSDDDKANDETSLTGWGFLFLSFFAVIFLRWLSCESLFLIFDSFLCARECGDEQKGMLCNAKKNEFKFSEIWGLKTMGKN